MNARRRFAPVALLAGAILVVSVLPPSGGTGAALGTTVFGVGLDKWLHAGTFAVLAVTAAWAGRLGRRRDARKRALAAVGIVATTALFGVGIELLQWPLDWRRASVADAAANAVGASVGVAALLLRRWLRRGCE